MRDDHARLGSTLRPATASGDYLAVGDDGARTVPDRRHLVVENFCLPGDFSCRHIETEDIAVVASIDNEPVEDRDVPVVA